MRVFQGLMVPSGSEGSWHPLDLEPPWPQEKKEKSLIVIQVYSDPSPSTPVKKPLVKLTLGTPGTLWNPLQRDLGPSDISSGSAPEHYL